MDHGEGAVKLIIQLRACFLSLAQSKLRLYSANHRPGYWSNLPCDWPSTAWAYSEGVSSDYAQPITGQVTEVTCPVIGQAQPELTPSRRQKTGPGLNTESVRWGKTDINPLIIYGFESVTTELLKQANQLSHHPLASIKKQWQWQCILSLTQANQLSHHPLASIKKQWQWQCILSLTH